MSKAAASYDTFLILRNVSLTFNQVFYRVVCGCLVCCFVSLCPTNTFILFVTAVRPSTNTRHRWSVLWETVKFCKLFIHRPFKTQIWHLTEWLPISSYWLFTTLWIRRMSTSLLLTFQNTIARQRHMIWMSGFSGLWFFCCCFSVFLGSEHSLVTNVIMWLTFAVCSNV